MRSKYHVYPEYHTSADDLSYVTATGLGETLGLYSEIVRELEHNEIYLATTRGEPQLGKRGLYPNVGGQVDQQSVSAIIDLLAYADGSNDIAEIASLAGHELPTLQRLADVLVEHGLLTTPRLRD